MRILRHISEKAMAPHSSTLAWKNPMDGGGWWAAVHGVAKSQTPLSNFTFTFHFNALEKEMATRSSVLPGESQGRGSLVDCHLWGLTESDTTKATWQQQQQQETYGFKENTPFYKDRFLPTEIGMQVAGGGGWINQ